MAARLHRSKLFFSWKTSFSFYEQTLAKFIQVKIWIDLRRAKGCQKSNNLAEKQAWFRDLVWHHYKMHKGCQLNNAADALKVDGDLQVVEVFSRRLGFCVENLLQVDLKPVPQKVVLQKVLSSQVVPLPKRLQASEEPRKRPWSPIFRGQCSGGPASRPCPKQCLRDRKIHLSQRRRIKKPLVPKTMLKRPEKPLPRKHENPAMPKAMPKKRPLHALEEEIANTPLPRPLPKKHPRPRCEYVD